jgi:hypothetical protein
VTNERSAVWERYVAAWKAGSLEEKRALFAGCLAPSCTYTDPLQQAEGWDALALYMVDFQRQVPGGHFITEAFSTHHDKSLAKWRMVNADGVKIGEGVSYGEYDANDRLIAMTGFFETPSDSA